MNIELIKNWLSIVPTNVENTNDIEYKKFIQLYFILNNFFCEIFPLGDCRKKDGQRMKEEFPNLVYQSWGSLDSSIVKELKDIHIIILKHNKFAIENNFYITKDKNDFSFTELIKFQYCNQDNYITTKSDVILFKTLSQCNYNRLTAKKAENILKTTLSILYAVRNNFYHGGKRRLPEQTQLLSYLNNIIIRVLQISSRIKPELFDTTINNKLTELKNAYDNEIANIAINYSRIINFSNIKFIDNFVSSECNLLTNLIEEKWDTKKEEIKKYAKEIKSILCKYIDTYISETNEESTNLAKRLIGHLKISSYSIENKRLTKRKIDLFRNLESLPTDKKSKIIQIFKIKYYLFSDTHINSQNIANLGICKLYIDLQIDNLKSVLNDNSIAVNLNIINNFKALIKSDLKQLLIDENQSINNWKSLPSDSYYKFAFSFIIVEKLNLIINRVIHSDETIIENLELLSKYLDKPFADDEGKSINEYRDIYDDIYTERKKIFHGDATISIDIASINVVNQKLKTFIRGVHKWLKVAAG